MKKLATHICSGTVLGGMRLKNSDNEMYYGNNFMKTIVLSCIK